MSADPVEWLPLPIARPLARLQGLHEGGTARFAGLLDLFESLVHFLALVGMSAFNASTEDDPVLGRRILGLLLQPNWSTGSLLTLCVDTTRRMAAHPNHPYPEAGALLFRADGRETPAHQLLKRVVELRNREWGHAAGRSDARFEAVCREHEAPLLQLIRSLDWLGARPVVQAEASGEFRRLHGRLGTGPAADHPPTSMSNPGETWVGNPRGGWLRLDPFGLVREQLEHRGVFLLQRLRWHDGAVRNLRYVAYDPQFREHEEGATTEAAQQVSSLMRRLGADAALQSVPSNLLLPEIEGERVHHRRRFVGRAKVLQRLLDHSLAGSGYLLLTGSPGQGKSAVLCQAADAAPSALVHLISVHGAPTRWIPSLAAQARLLAGPTVDLGQSAFDTDDLRQVLIAALCAVRDTLGRCVLILDGLDELPPAWWGLPFLPPTLPDGVVAILASRPDATLLLAARSRLRHLATVELPPLDDADARALLAGGTLAAAAQLATLQSAEGNPLLLQLAAQGLDAASPATVASQLWKQATGAEPGCALRRAVLSSLAIAREPLDVDDVVEVLDAHGAPHSREEVGIALGELSAFLRHEGDRWRPFHRLLADVALRELGRSGRRRMEAAFSAWIGDFSAGMTAYGRRHWADHAFAAGEDSKLAALFGNVPAGDAELIAAAVGALEQLRDAKRALPGHPPHLALAFAHRCEGRGWWDTAAAELLAVDDAGIPEAMLRRAQLASSRGRSVEALDLARRAVDAERDEGLGRWRALNTLGRSLIDLADEGSGRAANLDAAQAAFEHVAARASEDGQILSRALNNLGVIARLRGEKDQAWALQLRAAELRTRIGDRYRCWSLHDLGTLHADLGRPSDAHDCYTQALALATRGGDPLATLWCWRSLASVADDTGVEQALTAQVDLGIGTGFYEAAGYGVVGAGALPTHALAEGAEGWWRRCLDAYAPRSRGAVLSCVALAWVEWALRRDGAAAQAWLRRARDAAEGRPDEIELAAALAARVRSGDPAASR